MAFFGNGIFANNRKLSSLNEIKADGQDLNQDDQDQSPDYTQEDDNQPAAGGGPDNTPAAEDEGPTTDYTQDDTEEPAAADTTNEPEPTDYTQDDTEPGDNAAPATTDAPTEAPEGDAQTGGEAEPPTTDYTQDDTGGEDTQTNYDLPDQGEDEEPPTTDYTQDDGGEDAAAAGTDAGGEDTEGTTDYTQDDGEGGGDDQGTDYTQDDGGGDAEGGEDAAEGEEATDDQQGNQPAGLSQELKDLEAKLFSNLSQEQISIKNTELKLQYTDLYESISKLETRVDNLEKTEANLTTLDFVSKKLSELKSYVNDYIIKTFETNSYLENQINLKSFLVVLESINKILESLKLPSEKK